MLSASQQQSLGAIGLPYLLVALPTALTGLMRSTVHLCFCHGGCRQEICMERWTASVVSGCDCFACSESPSMKCDRLSPLLILVVQKPGPGIYLNTVMVTKQKKFSS